ncbi:MAG: ParA family protein [Deltaproteobacteria bacterium]|nr:ParA family protein [Deltaproteobacteria bacterium]
MNSIALFSIKGGTGKTTLSSSLGWIFAEQAHRVLMIDMDAQGHLTQLFKGKPTKGQTKLYYSLVHEQPLAEMIVPTSHPNLF